MSTKGNKNDKKKRGLTQLGVMVFMMLIGAVCGVAIGVGLNRMEEAEATPGQMFLMVAGVMVGLYVAIMLHVIVHEGGHLVAGLVSGYEFSSFRIGSFMLVKKEEGLTWKRFKLAGTGGQCLMVPPDMVDGKLPFILYNLGGCIANIIVALLFLVLYPFVKEVPYLSVFCVMMVLLGFADALTNGIPLEVGMLDNDGSNARALGRNPAALRAFWVQMKMNDCISRDMRLREMPQEWFEVPTEEEMKNGMVACLGVFACNRLLDEERFEEAATLIDKLLDMDTAIVPIHRNSLLCDRIFCELIGENRARIIEEKYTKELQSFMKSMKTFPSVLRTQYAYTLLYERDEEKAQKIWQQFEKVGKTYPNRVEIESEKELMLLAREKAQVEA